MIKKSDKNHLKVMSWMIIIICFKTTEIVYLTTHEVEKDNESYRIHCKLNR